MRKKLCAIILLLLVVTSDFVFGKDTNKSKHHKNIKKHNHTKEKSNAERIKRSIDDEEDKPFWANRGKKKIESSNMVNSNDNDMPNTPKAMIKSEYFENDPFWGMRGRRESDSTKHNLDHEYPDYSDDPTNCKNCYGTVHFNINDKNFKDRRDDNFSPFWGNRGRRSSNEIEDPDEPFWGNRGRRQDDEPFWGTRGRRKDSPFWGARGRREEEPFWGNRGRRDDEPFWGNRGRRQDNDPFWGNRGRRQDSEPFWGNRGRREDEPFWGNRGRRKNDLKESILKAISLVKNDIEHLSRLRRSDQNSFWSNRGRDSKLKYLFNTPGRNRFTPQQTVRALNMALKFDPSIMHDSRAYAEEPHFIVVERSSRSSGESGDPYVISRGKKYYFNYDLVKAARDRRGAIEEIVKSVRNDPFYIARGKKDDVSGTTKVNVTSEDEYQKAKELICSTVDMITAEQHNSKVKREIDSDRDRRTILKKLAAQLQNDPYYASRGKKNDGNPNRNLREFITEVAEKCP